MTDTQEKIRALFLSALMVFSVFAGTVAFSGAVAAAANSGGTPEDLVTGADSIDQQITGLNFDSDSDARVVVESLNDTGASFEDASVTIDSGSGVNFDEIANTSSAGPVTLNFSGTVSNLADITITGVNTSGASAANGLTYTARQGDTTADSGSFDLTEAGAQSASVEDQDRTIQNETTGFVQTVQLTNVDIETDGSTEITLDASDLRSNGVNVTGATVSSTGSDLSVTTSASVNSDENVVFELTGSSGNAISDGDVDVDVTIETNSQFSEADPVTYDVTGPASADFETFEVGDTDVVFDSENQVSPSIVTQGQTILFVSDSATGEGSVSDIFDDLNDLTPVGESITIREVTGSSGGSLDTRPIRTINTGTGAVVKFNTESLDAGTEYQIEFNDGTTYEFDLVDSSLNTSLDDTSVTTEDPIEGTITGASASGSATAELFEADADFDSDDPFATQTVSLDGVGDGSFSFDAVGAGNTSNYTVRVTDAQTGVTATTGEVNVTAAAATDAELADDGRVVEQQGDIAELTVNITGTDTAALRIGSDSKGFLLNGTVTDGNGDGQVTVLLNTVTYNIQAADTPDGDDPDSVSLSFTSVNPSDDPSIPTRVLATSNYNVQVVGGSTTPSQVDDRGDVNTGSLVIEQRVTENFRTHVIPGSADLDVNDDDAVTADDVVAGLDEGVVTPRSSVAAGDRLVHQVVASGLEGFINPAADDVGANVTDEFFNNVVVNPNNEPAQNGAEIILTVEQDSDNPNQDATEVILNRANTQVIAGEDQYFLITDTSALDVELDSDITATVHLNADGDNEGDSSNSPDTVSVSGTTVSFERFFETAEVSTTATPEEPVIEVTQANATVSENGTIEGETNLAPGTEVRVTASSDGDVEPGFINSDTVVVQTDETFNTSFDFTDNQAGDTYEVEVESLGVSASTTADGTLQAAQETPTDTPTVTDTPANETDTPANETVTDTPTPTETETDTPTPTETETDSPTPTETDSPTPTETDTETETETETETTTGTSTPGFTAVLGVVALLGAALVALRRQN